MMNMLDSDSDCETYTEASDSEDQDDSESTYGGNAQSILSSLDESIGKIDDFLAYERGFVHGDIVSSITDPSRQLGRVVDVEMVVDLETRSGEKIKGVNSKNLLKLRSFATGDYVVHGPWLGRVERVTDVVTILFSDGARCEVITGESEVLMPLSPAYPGQQVRIKLPTISRSMKWLCGPWKATRDEGTVCNVEVGLVHVNWTANVMVGWGIICSPPPSHIQDPKDLTLLSCFPYANWQLGDWCTLPSDYFGNLEMTTENLASPFIAPCCFSKMPTLGMGIRDYRQMYVIAKTKTKVDVLWQNGSRSVGLDSQTLFPVNNVGDHDFWPEQFVLEKVTSEDGHASSAPRLGIVKNVDAQERTVKVKWNILDGESIVETVSAYELIEHPDFSYCIGDVVFWRLPCFENSERTSLVDQINWQSERHELPFRGVFSSSLVLGKDSFRKNHMHEGHVEDLTAYLSYIGNVIGFRNESIEVRWATGLVCKVQPSEIFGLDKLDNPASVSKVIEETMNENVTKEMAGQENQSCLVKEKVTNSSREDHNKVTCDKSTFLLHWAPIGFLRNVVTSLFCSSSSTSLSSYWKGVSDFQKLETEESQLDLDDLEPASLKRRVEEEEEKEPHEKPAFSPDNEKPGTFKQFDVVDDYSDHHFVNDTVRGLEASQVKQGWLKKVQQEWCILKEDLPDSIYVRVYEDRIDLLRACIVGAPGTPYHDGLFFFDVLFPPEYPHEPPLVHYISGGLRLNPNLYESGKVCLSLLKTWTGTGTEVWNPKSSTILQVLLSLQALVLNDKPYFNEAGYDKQIGRAEGEKNSITYNENAFLLSCKSMLYLLHKPPKHFEALVVEHFTRRSQYILQACKAYMDGAQVGCAFGPGTVAYGDGLKSCSTGFKLMLLKLLPKLISGFTERGIDCSQFA